MAVGASRARLARQLLVEGLIIATAGTGAGLLLAGGLSRFLVSFLTTANNRIFLDLSLDFRIFAFAAATALLTCLTLSVLPAWQAARIEPSEALKATARTATFGRRHMMLHRLLVVSQIAVSLALLIASLLFVQSFRNLLNLHPGFQTHGLLLADLDFSALKLPPAHLVSLRRDVLRKVRAVPSVAAASEATIIPLTGGNWNARIWRNGSDLSHAFVSLRTVIGTQYFHTMETPLLAGRELDEHDIESAAKIAVVNEEFVRELMGNPNAVGQRFWVEATPYEPQTSYEIVGIVKNTKYSDLREPFQPIMYMPMWRRSLEGTRDRVLIRYASGLGPLTTSLRTALGSVNSEIRYSFQAFDTFTENSLLRERLMATLAGMFGILAVVLSAVGIYGVIAYTVACRTTEIGIRIALGAERHSVIRLVLQDTAFLVIAGLAAGSLLTFVAGRAATAVLFGISSYDPLTYLTAVLLLCAVALAASYIPAWRGSKLDPILALRQE